MDTKTDPQHSEEAREVIADAGGAGQRLDVFLAGRLPELSRSHLRRLIHAGCVETGGRVAAKGGEIVSEGDRIRVRLARVETRARPENLPVEIVYEDAALVVVNKPAGMVVHMGAGIHSGTLVNALLYHIRQLSTAAGDERPGIVHRLDKMTSGLMLVAKNDASHRALAAAFKERAVHKTYIALVHGRVSGDEGAIEAAVGRDPHHRYRMKAGGEKAREALTRFAVIRRFQDFTLLYAMPRTGRTHQIRVHLASIGHPVVGDATYGARDRIRLGGSDQKTLPRTFLHAFKLEFAHPTTGEPLAFEAPLPADLEAFLKKLA